MATSTPVRTVTIELQRDSSRHFSGHTRGVTVTPNGAHIDGADQVVFASREPCIILFSDPAFFGTPHVILWEPQDGVYEATLTVEASTGTCFWVAQDFQMKVQGDPNPIVRP